MFKKIQAYFKTEDDAEDVHATLNKLNIQNVLVDQLTEESDRSFIAPLGVNGSTSAANPVGYPVPSDFEEDDKKERSIMLEFEVEEEDFGEALNIIKENDGHVNRELF
ncbi:hypothetical protein GCM10011351_11790 [Paraliobacillus quinghaiensis]|uniref:Uncharacterized protein n=1 Tax=Paraliobacillus quinghaiensis TaxID=470815 RepID=A0A917TLD0_9BACI|nr:hypothetical protein [Paraliobacillus quinghaiensis]GGM27599.1 hypothetical protein GCM10011351_11790 [Paraliobacillus quinghaiensis]